MNGQVRHSFLLSKDWRDAEHGIELVEIRYACAPLGQPPEWRRDEQSCVLVPLGDDPLHRRCAVALPCGLGAGAAYVLHYYFLVVQHGRQRTLPPIVEEIVSRGVSYRDERGQYCAAAIQWSVGGAAAPNYTPLTAEPLTAAGVRAGALPAAGVPRLFVGRLWGPRGSTVYYVFHLHAAREAALGTAPDAERELWEADHGRLWQVAL